MVLKLASGTKVGGGGNGVELPPPVCPEVSQLVLSASDAQKLVKQGRLHSYESLPAAVGRVPHAVVPCTEGTLPALGSAQGNMLVVGRASYYVDGARKQVQNAVVLMPREQVVGWNTDVPVNKGDQKPIASGGTVLPQTTVAPGARNNPVAALLTNMLRQPTADATGSPTVGVKATTVQGSSAPNLRIPDNNSVGITDVIRLDGTASIKNISVQVDIKHTYRSDLRISLVAPDGTEVLLHNKTGGSADNIKGTYPTTLVPAQSLDILAGKKLAGQWKLKVADLEGQDVGRLKSWKITVEPKPDEPVNPTGRLDLAKYGDALAANGEMGPGELDRLVYAAFVRGGMDASQRQAIDSVMNKYASLLDTASATRTRAFTQAESPEIATQMFLGEFRDDFVNLGVVRTITDLVLADGRVDDAEKKTLSALLPVTRMLPEARAVLQAAVEGHPLQSAAVKFLEDLRKGSVKYKDANVQWRNDPYFQRAALCTRSEVWNDLPDATRKDPAFQSALLDLYPDILPNVDMQISTVEVMRKALKVGGHYLLNGTPELQGMVEFQKSAVAGNPKLIWSFPDAITNKEVVCAGLEGGLNINDVGAPLNTDPDVLVSALKGDPSLFPSMTKEQRADPRFVMAAVSKDGMLLQHALPPANKNPDVVMQAVKTSPVALQFADAALRNNRAIVLEAVKQNGAALQYASDALRADVELMREAVKTYPDALMWGLGDTRKDATAIITAMQKSVGGLQPGGPRGSEES